MLDRQTSDTAHLLAEASLYRGLCQRALGNEAAARKEFSAASIDGQLRPDAAAALDDPTYGATVTTAEAISARRDRWDPESGPSLADLRKAQQRQQAGKVLERAERELDEFIGLRRVKEHVNELKNVKIYDQKMAERGLQVGERDTLHMTLVGPGSAKTSIARLICEMYFGLGIRVARIHRGVPQRPRRRAHRRHREQNLDGLGIRARPSTIRRRGPRTLHRR